MSEIGTLKELNVKPGDVVEVIGGRQFIIKGVDVKGVYCFDKIAPYLANDLPFRIISRASDTPKLWRDMTDAEKGALLLAFHNDKKCLEIWLGGEWANCGNSTWKNDMAYRVRPEPKVQTHKHVVFAHGESRGTKYNTIDGKVDWSSFEVMDK